MDGIVNTGSGCVDIYSFYLHIEAGIKAGIGGLRHGDGTLVVVQEGFLDAYVVGSIGLVQEAVDNGNVLVGRSYIEFCRAAVH